MGNDEQEKEGIVTVAIADSFTDFNLIIKPFKLPGADIVFCMSNQAGKSFFWKNNSFTGAAIAADIMLKVVACARILCYNTGS